MSSSVNAEKIFYEALEIESEAVRTSYLKGACGDDAALRAEVDELLAAHDDAGSFMAGTIEFGESAPELSQIGPYKLLEEIGEGGMGSVWVAQQSKPIKRKVAIKLIKAGMDSKSVLARFEAERQALALMDHPNIARVLDGGMTDQGRPYFAMEYVKGVPLNEYCNQAKLSVVERLELFLPICHAVQHAHQKGIIHRDLKPANILVCLYDGKPVPKVIDFGLAKAMHQSLTENTLHTGHGMMLGTPLYMSPEQAESNNLDVDTRTDIYSLGVILYELLTGTTPLEKAQFKEAAVAEMLRMIKEVEPPKPSTRLSGSADLPKVAAQRSIDPNHLSRSVSGDLDWVIMKALEKDRGRRYETANGLAEDIRRHLSDEPVSASPPSRVYRLRKFVRRNRAGVIAAGLVGVALILGVAGTSWGMWSAQVAATKEAGHRKIAEDNEKKAVAAEAEAKQRSAELAQVSEFQSDQLSRIDLATMGQGLRNDIVEQVRKSISQPGKNQADVEKKLADLRETLKSVQFTDLARTTMNDNILDRALKTIEEKFDDQPLVKASLLQSVATTMLELELFKQAQVPQAKALKIRREQLPKGNEEVLESVLQTGYLGLQMYNVPEARKHVIEAFEDSQKYLGRDHQVTIDSKVRMASYLSIPRNPDASKYSQEKLLREALADAREFLGNEHTSTARAGIYLGDAICFKDPAEAETLLREAFTTSEKINGLNHVATMQGKRSLAEGIYLQQKRFPEAEVLLRELLERSEVLYGEDSSQTASFQKALSFALAGQDKFDEAIQLSEKMRATIHKLLGNGPMPLGGDMYHAKNLIGGGRDSEAETLLRKSLTTFEPMINNEGNRRKSMFDFLAKVTQMLGSILVRKGEDFPEAEKFLLKAFELFPDDYQYNRDLYVNGKSEFATHLIELYEFWHEAEPDAGHDKEVAIWKEKLQNLLAKETTASATSGQ